MRATVPRRVRRLLGQLRSLRSTRRTSLWEIAGRPPPQTADFREVAASAVVVPPAGIDRPELLSLGERVLLHEGVSILIGPDATGVTIGEGTRLSRYAHIACSNQVTIGANVSSSDHIAITDSWTPTPPGGVQPPAEAVVIEDGAYLGFGCVIGPGVTVGSGAFIGEGAVVLENVTPHTVVYGNPARPVRRLTATGWQGERFP